MLTENIARAFIKMVGEDKIKEGAAGLLQKGVQYVKEYPLQEGETGTIGILYEFEGRAMFATATKRETEAGNVELLRIDNIKPLDELLFNLLQKI